MFTNNKIKNNYSKTSWKNKNESITYPNGKKTSEQRKSLSKVVDGEPKPSFFDKWVEYIKVCPTCNTTILCKHFDYAKIKTEVSCPSCSSLSVFPSGKRNEEDKTGFSFQTTFIQKDNVVEMALGNAVPQIRENKVLKNKPYLKIDEATKFQDNRIQECWDVQATAKAKKRKELDKLGLTGKARQKAYSALNIFTKLAKQNIVKIYLDEFVNGLDFIKSRDLVNNILKHKIGRILPQPELTKYLESEGTYKKGLLGSGKRKQVLNKGNFLIEYEKGLRLIGEQELKNPELVLQIVTSLNTSIKARLK